MNVDQVIEALNKIAQGIEVPYQHWLGGQDADQGPSYCRPCAEKLVADGKGEFVDGGWQQDDDGCSHCEECGRLLDYSLTDYGAESELEHFKANAPTGPIDPETAFHLSRLLECHVEVPDVLSIIPAVVAALAAHKAGGGA